MNKATRQLLEENNRQEVQLTSGSKEALTNIVAYLRGSSVPMAQQEQVRRDILDMLLEGERRGQTANEILGADPQLFCEEILAELPKRSTGQQAVYGLSTASLSAAVLIAIWLVFGLLEAVFQGPFTFWLPVTAGQLFGGVLLILFSHGLVEYICRTSFRSDRHPPNIFLAALPCGMAAVFLLSFLLKQILFSLHAGFAVVLIAALYLIFKITDRMES